MITPEYLAKCGSEHGEQSALFCWAAKAMWQGFERANCMANYLVPPPQGFTGVPLVEDLRWMHAIPNGGGRSARQGADLKAEGVKGGVADVCLPVPRGKHHGLYIEMKKAKGVPSDVSKEQLEFGKFVLARGYVWIVCFGWQQAAKIVQLYLEGNELKWEHLSPHQIKVMEKARG
jgi:hypothetical protein